jgi:hypothetical protein
VGVTEVEDIDAGSSPRAAAIAAMAISRPATRIQRIRLRLR